MRFNKHWSLKLVGILIAIFIFQLIFPLITDVFILKSSDILTRPWILLTSIFLHGSLGHLLLNIFALALFGSILEEIIGSKRFIIIYLTGGIIASIVFILGLPILFTIGMPTSGNALGASGAIFSILGMLAVLRPHITVWISYMPMPMWIAAIVWAGQDLMGIFIPDNVANFAHLGGLLFGIIIGFFYKDKKIKKKGKKSLMLGNKEIEEWESKNFRI